MTPYIPQQLVRQLRELLSEKRVIFVHPNFKAQHLVFDQLLNDAVYVRFQGQELDAAQLREQFDSALRPITGKAKLDGKVAYAILDESDRATPKALIQILNEILGEMDNGRILVLSRVLLDGVLENEQLRQVSGFIPSDPELMLLDYTRNADDVILEVRAFGEGRVQVNGRNVESWDGALPRALFFYLVDRGMVTRAEIFKTFWANLSTREATNVFHVTKRKISEVLGRELTLYGSGFYHISPQIQLSYDVSLFNQLVQDSESQDDGDVMLRQAISLYRGDYLMSLKAEWVLERRESLQQSVCDAMVALGRIYENKGEPQNALSYYLRAAHIKPEREDSAFAIMRLYDDMKLPDDALLIYHRLVNTLRHKLKVDPSSHVQQLASQITK
jgi:DNA-binding SARP family transcriptional activator